MGPLKLFDGAGERNFSIPEDIGESRAGLERHVGNHRIQFHLKVRAFYCATNAISGCSSFTAFTKASIPPTSVAPSIPSGGSAQAGKGLT
jgi:hypothetical protein